MDGQNDISIIEECFAAPTEVTVACPLGERVTAEAGTLHTTATTPCDNLNNSNTTGSTSSAEFRHNHNDTHRQTRSRKKRQRKRPRSDWLMNETGDASNHDVSPETGAVVTRLDIVQQTGNGSTRNFQEHELTTLLRIVYPYPHTFTSFCKARWIGRSILDVYCTEFGSYPMSYYKIAIQQGRIRVSDQVVPFDYKLQANDVLLHTVHRHEPGVVVKYETAPYIHIVEETEDLIAIDKPSTLPVHPCGGYHRNSLMNVLHETYQNQKFYTIHRLDRLTSGLVVIAKNAKVAQAWGQAIQLRDQNCQKIYLARVKGHFGCNFAGPINNSSILPLLQCNDLSSTGMPHYGEYDHNWEDNSLSEGETRRKKYAYGYWMTDALTGDVFDSHFDHQSVHCDHSIDDWLEKVIHTNTTTTVTSRNGDNLSTKCRPFIWFNVACPVRVEQPKIGICAAGRFHDLDDAIYIQTVKPAQTRFGIVKYDIVTDSTIIIAQPMTGRTHQIRIHLQHMQHSIANDPNYGGHLWYGNPAGQQACIEAQQILDDCNNDTTVVDNTAMKTIYSNDGGLGGSNGLVTTDIPATEDEIQNSLKCSNSVRNDSELLSDWIQRTCVWCNRLYGTNYYNSKVLGNKSKIDLNEIVERRAKLEFCVRSPGLWLHAFQYTVNNKSFRTEIPDWCQFRQWSTESTTN